jgi:glycopeptide antibiotics resistance protein
MFIPFGILVPYIWSKTNNLKTILFDGFIFSLIIELSQLFNYRQTDIDDLLMNTLGTGIGFLLFKIASKILKIKPKFFGQIKYEPIIYILAIFLSHFLLYNENYLVKIIYGF